MFGKWIRRDRGAERPSSARTDRKRRVLCPALSIMAIAMMITLAMLVGPASQQALAATEADILVGDPITYTGLGSHDVISSSIDVDSADPSRVLGVAETLSNHSTHPDWVYGFAITTNGDTAILGETQPLFSSNFDGIRMALLDPSHAVFLGYKVGYSGQNALLTLHILTIDGQNQFTAGAANTRELPIVITSDDTRIAVLDDGRFVLTYAEDTGSGEPRTLNSVICTVNGDEITLGDANQYNSIKADANIAALDSDSFLIWYTATTANAPNGGTAMVATINGDIITYGTPTTFMVTQDVYYAQNPKITALDATHFAICSVESDGKTMLKMGTIDGISITIGDPVIMPFEAEMGGPIALDATHFAWTGYAYSLNTAYAALATVNGDEITLGDLIEYPHSIPVIVQPLEPSRFAIIGVPTYNDICPVGAICTVPSLAAAPPVDPVDDEDPTPTNSTKPPKTGGSSVVADDEPSRALWIVAVLLVLGIAIVAVVMSQGINKKSGRRRR